MIPLILIYHNGKESCRLKIRHYVVPRVGEKVIPDGEEKALTVLTVEHSLNDNTIHVVLN